MGTPRMLPSRRHKWIRSSHADYAIASTAWANLDTGLDLTVEAQTGDVLKAYVDALWDNQAFIGCLNAVTVVSGTIVNYFGQNEPTTTSGYGLPAWYAPALTGLQWATGGSGRYTVQAGDVASGQVTVRLRARITTAGSRNLFATTLPFDFAVENIGPVQGH